MHIEERFIDRLFSESFTDMTSHRELMMADTYDLLLKGGEVIDPSQNLHRYCDVAFRDGRVAAIAPDIAAATAEEVIDVSGYLVTPGLMDIHGHFFYRG